VVTTQGGVGLSDRVVAGGMVAAISCPDILRLVGVPMDVPLDLEGFVTVVVP
jgi:hypothetical protein